MRILVADDDAASRSLLAGVLKKGGHEVVETIDGAEAWEVLQQPDAPALAVLDWMMPKIDGPGVVRLVRSRPTERPPYLIMLTSKVEKTDIIAALKAGANDYLSKPFHIGELLARVESGMQMVEVQVALADKNEMLLQSQRELHASRARYFNLYDLAPVGYVTVSETGLILEANLTAATMLGTSSPTLVKRPISCVIHKEDADFYDRLHKQLLEGGDPQGEASEKGAADVPLKRFVEIGLPQSCELRMVKIDGTLFWAHLASTAAHGEDGSPILRIVMNDVTARKQAEEERGRHALTTTRRFLSVLVLELKYLGAAVQRLNPVEIQTGFDLFWNGFHRFVTDEGGLPLPPQSQEFIAVFGVETSYLDHAVRAGKAASAISTWLSEQASSFSQSGLEIPHFSIALHCGESVAMRIPGAETLPWAVLGEAVSFGRTLIRVCRTDEVICSESFLASFLENLPASQEVLEMENEEEPDLSELNWEVADFIPLEEKLRAKSVLVGEKLESQPASAAFRFTYLYSFSSRNSDGHVRVASVVFPGTIRGFLSSQATLSNEPQVRWMGKYRLMKPLGQGGMGTVWLGEDCFKNFAAIKTLHEPTSSGSEEVLRFEHEAKVMTHLHHRNICRILEMGEHDGTRYIAMEYISGIALAELLNNVPRQSEDRIIDSGSNPKVGGGGPEALVRDIQEKKKMNGLRKKPAHGDPPAPALPLEHALPLFLKICNAVQFAHEKGVLHRDLKPENILIRDNGEPVVCDFGLAKIQRESIGSGTAHVEQLIGTLAYMAPEQLLPNKVLDERADVFSLGSILYRMLAGTAQFQTSENFAADIHALEFHEPPPPSKFRREIPAEMDLIVMKALCKDPTARYQSVRSLIDDIARFLEGEPIRAQPPSMRYLVGKSYQRHRVAAQAIACSLAFSVAVTIFAFRRIASERENAVRALEKAESAEASFNVLLEKKNSAEAQAPEKLVQPNPVAP